MDRTIEVLGGNSANDMAGLVSLACQNKGLDAASVMAMCKNRDGFGLEQIIALVVVAAIFGNGNFGFGGNGNNQASQMIMDAIQRNGTDIAQLASTLGCSVQNIQNAIGAVGTQICNLSAQTGQSAANIIAQMQQGNMSLIQQICNCCCDLKSLIQGQTNTIQNDINFVNRSVERGFADLGYATRDQTCALQNTFNEGVAKIVEGQRAAEMREMQRDMQAKDNKIQEQAVELNNCKQNGFISQTVAQAIAPVAQALACLQKEVADIQCKIPATVTVPQPQGRLVTPCEQNLLNLALLGNNGGLANLLGVNSTIGGTVFG